MKSASNIGGKKALSFPFELGEGGGGMTFVCVFLNDSIVIIDSVFYLHPYVRCEGVTSHVLVLYLYLL